MFFSELSNEQRQRLIDVQQRAEALRQVLQGMARVNRAMALGRVPSLVGRILRRLDEAGVLGEQVCVVGTNALFAYEAIR